jgi:hypothetical protein
MSSTATIMQYDNKGPGKISAPGSSCNRNGTGHFVAVGGGLQPNALRWQQKDLSVSEFSHNSNAIPQRIAVGVGLQPKAL